MRKHRHTMVFSNKASQIIKIAAIVFGALIVVFLIATLTSSETSALNSAEAAVIKNRGALRVGISDEIRPFSKDGKGFEIELAYLLGKMFFPDKDEEGVVLVKTSPEFMSAKLNDGSIDVAIMLCVKNDSSSVYAYSDSYYTDVCRLAVKRGNEGMSLSKAKIGVVQNSVFSSKLTDFKESSKQDFEVVLYASYPQMFGDLTSGRLDAVAASGVYIEKYSTSLLSTHSANLGSVDYAIACSSDSPALAQIGSQLIQELTKDGRLDELKEKYGLE